MCGVAGIKKCLTNWLSVNLFSFFNFFFSFSFIEFTVTEHAQVLELLCTTSCSMPATAKLQETAELDL